MKVSIKKLRENAIIPKRATTKSAGYDLFACIDETLEIKPHETKVIPTGVAIELPHYTFGAIFARSGLATKRGLRPSNCVGVCDEDYRGEYMVALYNDSDKTQLVEPKERIAQLVIVPYAVADFETAEELSVSERKDGGFGHSGRF